MASEESIRTDASTVHRADLSSGEIVADSDLVASQPSPPDAEQIAEAKTVIRGSSRVDGELRSLGNTPAAVAKVLQGKHLDHFLLQEMIGGGGMGAVFRAHDEQLDRTVAIKVIPFVGEDVDLRRRFRNEAQSAARLDHPRIASIFGVGHRGDWHYIVFEYIRGTNIRDLVSKDGVLSIDDAVYYTCELAAALQHAADRGIVHRDIKPSNVLIGDDNNIKLVDMGLARSDNLELSEDMTASGVTLGTFDYISPEQARDPRDADLRSDLYSLGCTLYFMLTGSPPYPGGTMLQKLLSHGNAPPPDPRELRPDVSSDLAAVIQKMLAKDPDARYQNASDLIADMRDVSFRDGLVRAQGTRPIVVREPSTVILWLERHAPWLIATSLLLASAGWLHLSSVASREDFSLTPSPTAEALQWISAQDDVQEEVRESEAETRSQAAAPAAAIVSPDSELSVPDAAPPSLRDVPIPPELSSGAMPIGEAENAESLQPSEAGDTSDPSARDAEVVEFKIDDSSPVDPLITEPLIAPSAIRVLGPRESMDLLADPRERYEDGVLLSASLAEALDLAQQYAANRIEIAAPLIYSEPVTVKSDGLLITSTFPGGSVVAFRSADVAGMERARMLTIGSNRIDIDDLHFVWDVSLGLVDGGALVSVNDNRLIRMTDCSITINNPASVDEVFAFDVVTDREPIDGTVRDSTSRGEATLPLVAIELNNVIIRGQMTMVHMDFATELQLQWDNGLLAVSERMIDSAGARFQPPLNSGPLTLSLTRLTAHVPLGLTRMRMGANSPYPIAIDRWARNSLFVLDRDRPYVEFLGLKTAPSQTLLKLRGEGNVYVAADGSYEPMFSRTDQNGVNITTGLSELAVAAPAWFTESSIRRSVRWSSGELADVAANRLEPMHFRQDVTALSGFDESELPQLPDILSPTRGDNEATDEAVSRKIPKNTGEF